MTPRTPEDFMKLALQEAEAAFARDEVPIGAIIVDRETGEIIAASGNETEAQKDPTAHAELVAIRKACQKLNSTRIPNCDLYVTLEPCTMCAGAIAMARIHTVYYGASDPKGGGIEQGAAFFTQPTCHHRPRIEKGLLAEPSSQILKRFFAAKRG